MNFCPNSVFSQGYCCQPEEVCPKSTYGCSLDQPKAPRFFKYLLCPNEPACEEKHIFPDYNGEVLKRSVDKYTYKMVKGDVCSYIIHSPDFMTEYDKMYLKVYNIDRTDVYLAKGKSYLWFDHLD